MVASLLISILAFGMLALCHWRESVGGIATRPISDEVRLAADLHSAEAGPADFGALAGLYEAAAALSKVGGGAGLVSVYYGSLRTLGGIFPSLSAWSQREMTVCSRYMAALLGRSLAHNAACVRDPHLR